jgi:hypothetical protein
MSTHTTLGISRRTWRTALIVFLVVLLTGSGVSGASALWSKQATVTTTVSTGTWAPVLDNGWGWTPVITARKVTSSSAHHQIIIDWPDLQASTPVTYTATLVPNGGGQIQATSSVPGDSSAMQYEIHHNFLPDTFTFTVTATTDGKTSARVTRTIYIEDKTGTPTIRP